MGSMLVYFSSYKIHAKVSKYPAVNVIQMQKSADLFFSGQRYVLLSYYKINKISIIKYLGQLEIDVQIAMEEGGERAEIRRSRLR